ncbi:peptide ABC transporter substrate-binding protein [Gammaproteobacteria bacterium]|nr:peptide ABC transporter substrate-binding protein [Gammaproteobacteria bacterium]
MNKILLSFLSLVLIISCSKSVSPVDTGLENQTFHFGNGSEPQGIDPHIVTGVPEHHLLIALCEGLTTSNPRGGESLAGAAESWDISEDGRIYTFNLQKNGKWSNGDSVTAQDFVWSWMRVLTPSLGSQYPDMLYYVVGAEEYHTDPYFSGEQQLSVEVDLQSIKRLDELKSKQRSKLTTHELEELIILETKVQYNNRKLAEELESISSKSNTELYTKPSFDMVGVRALDDLTLEVTLKEPTPFFLGLLSHYSTWPVHKETVLKHGSIDDRNGQWTRPGNFVCNGAFQLKSWELNSRIIVEKNPMYWDANTVGLNEIHYYPVQNVMTEDRMFRAGQLHVTSTLPSQKCPVYIEEKNPDLRIDPYMGTYFYRLNTKHPVLQDPKVRRALAFSIDRKQLVDKVTKCGQIPAYSFTPPGSNGYEPDTSITFDPEYAKSLLKEAGYDENNPFPELEILFNTNEDHRKIALAIQQMWQQNLGVQIKLVNQDWKVYLNREMIGDFEVSRAGWIGDYEDPNTFLDTLRPNRGNNKTGWANAEYDSLVEKANETQDQAKRYDLLNTAEKILIDEMPIIPLYTYVRSYQLSPDVKGYYPNYLDHHHPKYIYLERD